MPDPESSIVTPEYKRGLRLAQAGEFFEAHEAFELAWRACDGAERDFFQGLVHVVVSAYQRERGRPVAAERQRVKAMHRLEAFAPEHRGLDVAALLDGLDRAEADPREQLVERDAEPPVAVEEEQQPEGDERRT
jgi:predicted metal-dependent hydrolase